MGFFSLNSQNESVFSNGEHFNRVLRHRKRKIAKSVQTLASEIPSTRPFTSKRRSYLSRSQYRRKCDKAFFIPFCVYKYMKGWCNTMNLKSGGVQQFEQFSQFISLTEFYLLAELESDARPFLESLTGQIGTDRRSKLAHRSGQDDPSNTRDYYRDYYKDYNKGTQGTGPLTQNFKLKV